MFTGKFSLPDLKLYPTPNTIPIPANDKFGPIPNSNPLSVLAPIIDDADGKNLPLSIPPTNTIHSTIPVIFPPPSANLLSHCHPYRVVNAAPVVIVVVLVRVVAGFGRVHIDPARTLAN